MRPIDRIQPTQAIADHDQFLGSSLAEGKSFRLPYRGPLSVVELALGSANHFRQVDDAGRSLRDVPLDFRDPLRRRFGGDARLPVIQGNGLHLATLRGGLPPGHPILFGLLSHDASPRVLRLPTARRIIKRSLEYAF